jgi:hypothetical protein
MRINTMSRCEIVRQELSDTETHEMADMHELGRLSTLDLAIFALPY